MGVGQLAVPGKAVYLPFVLHAVEAELRGSFAPERLLVDLADTPDLFLQISCVSMGIPQVLRVATQYMHPGKNGRLNKDLTRLGEDIRYYLDSLSNWNQASIQSYKLGKKHTTQYLIKQWKEVIVSIGNSTSITAGNRGF